jgi:hypothetical protein
MVGRSEDPGPAVDHHNGAWGGRAGSRSPLVASSGSSTTTGTTTSWAPRATVVAGLERAVAQPFADGEYRPVIAGEHARSLDGDLVVGGR